MGRVGECAAAACICLSLMCVYMSVQAVTPGATTTRINDPSRSKGQFELAILRGGGTLREFGVGKIRLCVACALSAVPGRRIRYIIRLIHIHWHI